MAKTAKMQHSLDSVDIRLVAGKGLHGFASTDIPYFGSRVACTRDEQIGVWSQRDATCRQHGSHPSSRCKTQYPPHNIPCMIIKLHCPDPLLDIPQHTSHIPRTRHNLPVIDESTTTDVSRMGAQLSRDFGLARARRSGRIGPSANRVERTDIIETASSHQVAARGISARHDPAGTEGDGVYLVRRVGVPNDEFTVLRGRDNVPLVSRPLERVDLGEMAFERAARFEGESGECGGVVCHRTD
jgi:hypothetical protein